MTCRVRVVTATVAAVAALAVAGCSDGEPAADSPRPSPSVSTLTPIQLPPPPPPTGRLRADMRQSSRDAAAGRMEVWIDNDTARDLTPTRVVYRDPRFRGPLPGTRLRPVPSQSERGFPVYLPRRPACEHPSGPGMVTISYAGTSRTVPVRDPTDVAGRYARSRCLELAVGRVATLAWDDAVPADGDGGPGSHGTLTLLVAPTGRPGGALTIDTISGTPVLSPVGSDVWRPGVRVTGTDEPRRVELPLKPTRCDAHAFAESGGATAFKIALHLDGRPGQITLRMSVPGAAHAITFAKESCGDLLTMS
jgi:hypothetical protein